MFKAFGASSKAIARNSVAVKPQSFLDSLKLIASVKKEPVLILGNLRTRTVRVVDNAEQLALFNEVVQKEVWENFVTRQNYLVAKVLNEQLHEDPTVSRSLRENFGNGCLLQVATGKDNFFTMLPETEALCFEQLKSTKVCQYEIYVKHLQAGLGVNSRDTKTGQLVFAATSNSVPIFSPEDAACYAPYDVPRSLYQAPTSIYVRPRIAAKVEADYDTVPDEMPETVISLQKELLTSLYSCMPPNESDVYCSMDSAGSAAENIALTASLMQEHQQAEILALTTMQEAIYETRKVRFDYDVVPLLQEAHDVRVKIECLSVNDAQYREKRLALARKKIELDLALKKTKAYEKSQVALLVTSFSDQLKLQYPNYLKSPKDWLTIHEHFSQAYSQALSRFQVARKDISLLKEKIAQAAAKDVEFNFKESLTFLEARIASPSISPEKTTYYQAQISQLLKEYQTLQAFKNKVMLTFFKVQANLEYAKNMAALCFEQYEAFKKVLLDDKTLSPEMHVFREQRLPVSITGLTFFSKPWQKSGATVDEEHSQSITTSLSTSVSVPTQSALSHSMSISSGPNPVVLAMRLAKALKLEESLRQEISTLVITSSEYQRKLLELSVQMDTIKTLNSELKVAQLSASKEK